MVDPESNRAKYEITRSTLPSYRDREKFDNYLMGILLNYLTDELLSYAIGQAYQCWVELNPPAERVTITEVPYGHA